LIGGLVVRAAESHRAELDVLCPVTARSTASCRRPNLPKWWRTFRA